jgi:hypothetical protein
MLCWFFAFVNEHFTNGINLGTFTIIIALLKYMVGFADEKPLSLHSTKTYIKPLRHKRFLIPEYCRRKASLSLIC